MVNNTNEIQQYINLLKEKGIITQAQGMSLFKRINDRGGELYKADLQPVKDTEKYIITAFRELAEAGIIPQLPRKKENAPIDTLREYIKNGFSLYAKKTMTDGNAVFCNWHDGKIGKLETSKIETLEELQQAVNNGIIRFTFRPAEKKYICFDLDTHPGQGNGIELFKAFLRERGKDNLSIFKNFPENFPVYTESPNGLHLYFKGDHITADHLEIYLRNAQGEKLEPIEVKHGGKDLTAGGSIKNNCLYSLHGELKDAPPLPIFFIDYLSKSPKEELKRPYSNTKTWQKKNGYSLQQLIEYARADHQGEGRNNTAYAIGYRVGKQYSYEEIKAECSFLLAPDFSEKELETALKSGIKNSKH